MKKIQDYTIIEKIDETLSSEVYRAIHGTDADRTFVIKILKVVNPTTSEIARFKQEYALIKKIDLPGVIRTYDLLAFSGKFALVLEDFQGIPLNHAFQKQPLPIKTFLEIAIVLSDTIGNIHNADIVHMDIKPRNILINPETHQIKITDFGISAQMTHENEEIYNPEVMKGTLAYMSPEQTGRMNRQVDYRTDLYSLGITFYELLTGTLPFLSNDPLEMIHAHIAKKPIPPNHLNMNMPTVISDIVIKLMSKTAEDRYQSSFGLLADLQTCLVHLNTEGEIPVFNLGEKDASIKFNIPQKLYGRDLEIKKMIKGFEEVSLGSTGFMFVSGHPGVGKTALINDVQTAIVKTGGYFISGKYEQIRRDVPYTGITQAFQGLIKQLLRETGDMIDTWKKKLLTALSPNESIIVHMIPEIAHIIGRHPHPAIAESGSEEFKNRFTQVFKNFIRVFAQQTYPLVLFLDDLQWVDLSSLQLLKSLVTDSDISCLYIIAAYRSTDISHGHPLTLFMDDLKARKIPFREVNLQPLSTQDVHHLILDLIRCTTGRTEQLADLVHHKTGGNPFFINQFMKMLHELKLIRIDPETGWQWDIDQIRQMNLTDNVATLLSDKISQLPEHTGDILKIGACFGNRFDLEMPAVIMDKPLDTLWQYARHAINDGYIDIRNGMLQFQHDRIREAAYLLIPEEKRKKIHHQIARLAIEKASDADILHHVFYITDHLNRAGDLIAGQEGKNELAGLNLTAGEKSIQSAAYASALIYFEKGISLLGDDTWDTAYHMTLKLYEGASAAACFSGRFDDMDAYCEAALPMCRDVLDQVAFYEYKVLSLIAKNESQNAIRTGLVILSRLGISFPNNPTTLHALLILIRVRLALSGKSTQDLLNLPKMTDPKILAAGRIISRISTPAFQSNPNLYILLEFKYLLLSVRYGNTAVSGIAYGAYAIFLCAFLEDFDHGYQLGEMILKLYEKLGDKRSEAHIIGIFNVFVRHWKDSVHMTLPHLLNGFQIGKETGDLELGAYCLFSYCGYAFLAGRELRSFNEELTKHMQAIRHINQETPLLYTSILKQVVLNLRGESENPSIIAGRVYNEAEMLPVHLEGNDQSALAFLYCHKLYLSYIFDNLHEAVANAGLMKKYFDGTRSSLNDPRYYMLSALVDLARYPDVKKFEKKRILKRVAKAEKKLKKYARYSPENTQFAYDLVSAEHAGVLGDFEKAVTGFEKARIETRKNGFIHYEAMACELTAKFYLKKNNSYLARIYMQDAQSKYTLWGAIAKARHLQSSYPDLFTGSHSKKWETIPSTVSLSTLESTHQLDFSAIIKASEAIFGEIVLSRLLKRLMGILIENAGAEKGFIILADQDKLLVEAEGHIETEHINVLTAIPVDLHEGLSPDIVNYTARIQQNVILNNASEEGDFTRDPYVVKHRAKSILCMPVLNQGRLIAILYLENTLATNVFTPQRLHVLNMLSAQLAVAIDNARLYENLEQKVNARTRQLELAQAENLRKAHRAGMADIAKETLHNVGNILNSVKTVADTMKISKRNSALSGLSSANAVAKKNLTNLAHFITTDPKGKKLIDYYIALEDLFNRENEHLEKQVRRLQKKVDDIVDVIHTLQSHIGTDDTYMEVVHLKKEVDFILESKLDTLMKNNINIVKKYTEVPVVKIQKSKLAHILDNVITNAREAMDTPDIRKKTLYVEIESRDNIVYLHIRDTGIGIPEKNIRKVFFHGFTTKEGRIGHNLHNCANNMAEMGGRIWAESDGKGNGATFTLEFPVNP